MKSKWRFAIGMLSVWHILPSIMSGSIRTYSADERFSEKNITRISFHIQRKCRRVPPCCPVNHQTHPKRCLWADVITSHSTYLLPALCPLCLLCFLWMFIFLSFCIVPNGTVVMAWCASRYWIVVPVLGARSLSALTLFCGKKIKK